MEYEFWVFQNLGSLATACHSHHDQLCQSLNVPFCFRLAMLSGVQSDRAHHEVRLENVSYFLRLGSCKAVAWDESRSRTMWTAWWFQVWKECQSVLILDPAIWELYGKKTPKRTMITLQNLFTSIRRLFLGLSSVDEIVLWKDGTEKWSNGKQQMSPFLRNNWVAHSAGSPSWAVRKQVSEKNWEAKKIIKSLPNRFSSIFVSYRSCPTSPVGEPGENSESAMASFVPKLFLP